MLDTFYTLAFTHHNLDVSEVGKLHVEKEKQKEVLSELKKICCIDELMFLSTCNRVEFFICTKNEINSSYLTTFFKTLYPNFTTFDIDSFVERVSIFSGIGAVEHLLQVASSIDSMIIGEREIITQVRNAFEESRKNELTGDFIRLLIRHTIETAKKVYTETSIAQKPVSVVALAYHTLRDLNIPLSSRVLIVGAGVTNTNMARFLKKHGFKSFVVFNRTLSKAKALAEDIHGEYYSLEKLLSYEKGFDILISCTASKEPIITPKIFHRLLNGEKNKKVIIDLAIPHDIDDQIVMEENVVPISVDTLQKISDKNLRERSKEITHVDAILKDALIEFQHIQKIRKVEIAMRTVPELVKEIKQITMNEVFKKEIEQLDSSSKEVLDKVISYMEKKYISMPMKMAKEILLSSEI
ncbi:MAG: glutamyl-tRNA reductase [Flavobacteriia bacterium]|nr:glutamyl-tRNA reductase [Flavobacteriia bacterium]